MLSTSNLKNLIQTLCLLKLFRNIYMLLTMDEFINNVGLKIVLKTFMSSSNNLQEDSCVKHESFPCLTWCVLSIETT